MVWGWCIIKERVKAQQQKVDDKEKWKGKRKDERNVNQQQGKFMGKKLDRIKSESNDNNNNEEFKERDPVACLKIKTLQ